MTSEPKVCRFCLSTKNGSSNPFLNPCKCKGSLEFVHLKCLNRWRRMDMTRNGKVCSLCLGTYKFLPLFEMEFIPQTNTWSLYFLSYPGLILMFYNYVYLVILSTSTTELVRDRFFYKSIYIVTQYLFHLTYLVCFHQEWKVIHRERYWAQMKSYVPFVLSSIHIYLLVLLSQETYSIGTLLSFYMGFYWQIHIRFLKNINQTLLELDGDLEN